MMIRLLISVLWVMGSVPAVAAEIQGVHFPEKVQVAGKALVLKGVGIRTATVLGIKVFVAALYVPASESDPVALWANGGALHFLEVYVRNVSQSQVRDGFLDLFGRNAKTGSSDLKKEIEAYGKWIPGFQKGDSLMVTQSEAGVEISATQAPQKFRGSREFSKLIFSLWLGPDADEGLKRGILGVNR